MSNKIYIIVIVNLNFKVCGKFQCC